jgi:hypothetical protein
MAGLVPAIHFLATEKKGVDARVKPGHDGVLAAASDEGAASFVHATTPSGRDSAGTVRRISAM